MSGVGSQTVDLPGLDGSNLLAFLAALGTLRLADSPEAPARLGWTRAGGGWIARLETSEATTGQELARLLTDRLHASAVDPAFTTWDDLSVSPEEFRDLAERAARTATPSDRALADFVAAFGCEATAHETAGKRTIQDTALRTMSGAGHQHFLQTMRHVLGTATVEQVRKALFEPWTYDDPVEKSTLRWDPTDDVRYALRWRNPSGDPERKKRGSMLAANALAVHALPFFPTAPTRRGLTTTGFSRFDRQVALTWPIWEPPTAAPVVRSLLGRRELQTRAPLEPDCRATLLRLAVAEIYRSRRITTGKFRNFTPAEPV